MVNRHDVRKSAYHYICELNKVPICMHFPKEVSSIPLDELQLLKDGVSDPSPRLVADIKKLFVPAVGEAEIDAHLVTPFLDKQ